MLYRLGLGATAITLAAPLLLTAAMPRLAYSPDPPDNSMWQTVPEAGMNARPTLDGLVDELPLVVRDLPDDASQLAVSDNDRATLFQPQIAADMFIHAWSGLSVPAEYQASVAELGRRLLLKDVPPDGLVLASPEFSRYVGSTIQELDDDPRNVDRINNAAVALFYLGVSGEFVDLDYVDGFGETIYYANSQLTSETYVAFLLLQQTENLHSTRPIGLNLGYLYSLQFGPSASIPIAVDTVKKVLATDPSDQTARLLLGNLQARQEESIDLARPDLAPVGRTTTCSNGQQLTLDDALGWSLATLEPLVSDPLTNPLGHAAQGDAYLTRASIMHRTAPFQARAFATCALAQYDAGLGATQDPSIYAGRAAALDLLSQTDAGSTAVQRLHAAVAAQLHAIELDPSSIELRLRLSVLYAHASAVLARAPLDTNARAAAQLEQLHAMEDNAQSAYAELRNGWDPALAHARFVTDPGFGLGPTPGDRGYLGLSYGSSQDHIPVSWPTQGGGSVVTLDLIPQTNDPNLEERWLGQAMPDVAGDILAEANIGLAAAVGTPQTSLEIASQYYPASGQALGSAQTALRHLGLYQAAEDMCSNAAAEECAGESAYLAGDWDLAASLLQDVNAKSNTPSADGAADVLRAAEASLRAGNITDARQLFSQAARAELAYIFTDEDVIDKSLGALSLADMDLNSAMAGSESDSPAVPNLSVGPFHASLSDIQLGQSPPPDLNSSEAGKAALRKAIAEYDAALSPAHRSRDTRPYWGSTEGAISANDEPEFATVIQRARNNRGIAQLLLNKTSPGQSPDCSGDQQSTCERAQLDFQAALRLDPSNPVYLVNSAWVARLLGGTPAGEVDSAQRIDPTLGSAFDDLLASAFNDAGVALARDEHDPDQARTAFHAALAARPNYDLAAWNLGVFELQRGVLGIPEGQANLERAISENADLRNQELRYITDERVRQFAIGPGGQMTSAQLPSAPISRVTLLFALLAVLVASSRLLVVEELIPHIGGDWLLEHIARRYSAFLTKFAERLGAMGRVPSSRREAAWLAEWRPWLMTVPILAMVTAWTNWRETSDARLVASAVVSALGATLLAVLTHEIGHLIAVRWVRARVIPRASGAGIVLAVLLPIIGLSGGPYVGHEVEASAESRAWWVSCAGPLATVLYAASAFALWLIQPLPLLLVIAEAQLVATSYALLPLEPLDGGQLLRSRPAVYAVLWLVVVGLVIVRQVVAPG